MRFDFNDINLVPKKCIVESRAECDTSVQFGPKRFRLPVVPSNMEYVAAGCLRMVCVCACVRIGRAPLRGVHDLFRLHLPRRCAINEALAQSLAANGYFYVMHRYGLWLWCQAKPPFVAPPMTFWLWFCFCLQIRA